MVVADEGDELDAGLVAFGDLEHQIDAVVRQFDEFRLDAHVEAAGAAVDFDNALDVGLYGRLGQRAARLGLHLGLELLVLGLLVAFKGNAVDHRVFDHGDNETVAGMIDADVGEQAGRVKRLQRLVDVLRAAAAEIGANGIGFDAAIAFDGDGKAGLRERNACRYNGPANGTHKDTAEDDAAKGKSPNQPQTKSHA